MKLKLTLPDWADDMLELYIITGTGEVVAKRIKGQKWQVKIVRCKHCGECCVPSGQTEKCNWLKVEDPGLGTLMCGNPDRPFHCVKGNGTLDCPDKCSVRFKEV